MLRVLTLLLLASVAHAADAEWLWIKTQSLSKDWAVSTGRAEVKIQGGRFTAKLYSKTAPDAVRAFVAAHEGELSGLTRREALKRLTRGT